MVNQKRFVYSSSLWLQKHFKDSYVKEAQKNKLRSRSWFKLDIINRIDSLFFTGMTVVDLGSTPGGWSLYVSKQIGCSGNIIACDILPMRDICGVQFLQGDCSDPDITKKLFKLVGYKKAQIVLSDMSPNITGISIIDVNRSIYLGRLALDICRNVLQFGGSFLVKIFQGREFEQYVYDVSNFFCTVKIRKPHASRSYSREVYVMAKKYKV